MNKAFLQILLLILSLSVEGQVTVENVPGQVSYVSTRNIYVKFKSTSGLSPGDTLFLLSGNELLPVLIINDLSSSSSVCTPLDERLFAVSDPVFARIKKEKPKTAEIVPAAEKAAPDVKTTTGSTTPQAEQKVNQQQIKGSISMNSYTDVSDTDSKNSQRMKYTLSMDAANIGNTKLSVDSYISFRHKAGEWEDVKNNIFKALKIYNLSLRYDLNETTRLSLGRKINPRISSAGAMDGLQIEKNLGKFIVGAIAGSRPDFEDYGFNSKLFQYGFYAGYNSGSSKVRSESSIALLQQYNDFRTDRRFLYFQNSTALLKNLNSFSTFEIDLYELKIDSLNNKKSRSTFDLTGLYLSLRYKINRNLSVYGSYDARKNIIYYETYRTSFDHVLETELRQGFRLQAVGRISRNVSYGAQAGYRFLKSDPVPSRNLHTWVTYSQIPLINLSATLSATYIESSHMNGMTGGINLNRDFLTGKLQTGIGYRYMNYKLTETLSGIVRNIAEIRFSWIFYKNYSVALNYEGTFEQKNTYNRIYLQARMRF